MKYSVNIELTAEQFIKLDALKRRYNAVTGDTIDINQMLERVLFVGFNKHFMDSASSVDLSLTLMEKTLKVGVND